VSDEEFRAALDEVTGCTAGSNSLHRLWKIVLTYDRGAEKAARISAAIRKFPVQWHHSDDALCTEAAKLKAAHKAPFADSFVAATALRLNATLVRKDPEFGALAGVLKLHPLPPKTGAPAPEKK